MADVFISYCSSDRARVGELAQALEREGLSVWWDRALIAGASYEAEIDAALADAKAVVVAWTPAAVASDWVRSEADSARHLGKLVPLVLEASRVPRPFDRLHTIDMSAWRGDRGNQGFPETLEALKALAEGRAAKPIPWRRRITAVAVGSALITTIIFLGALTQIGATLGRMAAPGAFASEQAGHLSPGASAPASPATQEGFRQALQGLATSTNARTQAALSSLQSGDRGQAIEALRSLADEQGSAIDTQMQNAGSLWRQIGLLQFESNPASAREALERALRYIPDDPAILTALSALYQRAGRVADAEGVSRRALALGRLSPLTEARLRQVIGEALLDRGDLGSAGAQFENASNLADAQASEDAEQLVSDLNIDKANVTFAQGDSAGALRQLDDAMSFATSLPYPQGVDYINFNAAIVYISTGALTRADGRLRAITSQTDRFLLLHVRLAQARIAAQSGDLRRALDIAELVRREASDQQLRPVEYEALMAKAEYETALGQPTDGERDAQSAIDNWNALSNTSSASIAQAVKAYAISAQAPRAREGCARLNSIAPIAGYAGREVERIRARAHCA